MRDCRRTDRALAVADESDAHLVLVEIGDLAIERVHEQAHQCGDFIRRTLPVLAGECEDGERFDAALRALLDRRTHARDAFLVAGRTRQATGVRPAPVAVHDDRDVTGQQLAQICMISFSFAARTASTSGNVLVGELLDLRLRTTLVVLRDELFLQRFLHVLHDVAADVADRDARVLRIGLAPPW